MDLLSPPLSKQLPPGGACGVPVLPVPVVRGLVRPVQQGASGGRNGTQARELLPPRPWRSKAALQALVPAQVVQCLPLLTARAIISPAHTQHRLGSLHSSCTHLLLSISRLVLISASLALVGVAPTGVAAPWECWKEMV